MTGKTAAERSLVSSAKVPKIFVVTALLNQSTKEVNVCDFIAVLLIYRLPFKPKR